MVFRNFLLKFRVELQVRLHMTNDCIPHPGRHASSPFAADADDTAWARVPPLLLASVRSAAAVGADLTASQALPTASGCLPGVVLGASILRSKLRKAACTPCVASASAKRAGVHCTSPQSSGPPQGMPLACP